MNTKTILIKKILNMNYKDSVVYECVIEEVIQIYLENTDMSRREIIANVIPEFPTPILKEIEKKLNEYSIEELQKTIQSLIGLKKWNNRTT